MKELMERVKERIQSKNLKKEDWTEDILILEKGIINFLTAQGYDDKIARSENLTRFEENTDANLTRMKQLSQRIMEDKEKGLIEGVLWAINRMRDFLDNYHIGYLNNLCLQKSGISVDLSLAIMNPQTSDSHKESDQKKFERQIQTLREIGLSIEMSKRTRVYHIIDTQENKKCLISLLSQLGMKRFHFESNENEIDKVSGVLDIEKFYSLSISKAPIMMDEETILNDRLLLLESSYNHLYSAIAAINGQKELINTCGYLIEHYFSGICEALGIETNLSKKVENYHKEGREKNEKIREYKETIGKSLNPNELLKYGKDFLYKNGLKAMMEIGFDLDEQSYIGPYHAHLVYRAPALESMIYHFGAYEAMSYIKDDEEDRIINKTLSYLEKRFDLIEPFKGERYIAYTEKNMNLLSDWVSKTFHVKFDSVAIDNKKGMYYIKSFTISINNLKERES